MTIAARFAFPRFIERAKTQDVTLDVWSGAEEAEITSATYTLYNRDSVAVVDAQTATVSDNELSYTVPASAIPATEGYSTRWREQWAVVIDGVVSTLRRDVHLVPLELYPVITADDLTRRYNELKYHIPESLSNWQHVVDEAWAEIIARIVSEGKQPSRIITPWSLRNAHLNLSLCFAWRECSVYEKDGRFAELADHHCQRYSEAWSDLTFEYDSDDDGDSDGVASTQGPILATSANMRHHK